MKLLNFVDKPVGMGRGTGSERENLCVVGVQEPKLWIPVVLAAASLAASLYGGYKSSQEAKKAERRQREKEAADRAWYTRRYNEDYLDTKAGQNLVRKAKDYANEQYKRAAGAQAVTGGTDAATQMAKEAGNRMVGDTIANIGAADQQRKAQVDAIQRQNEAQYAQMDMARAQAKAQAITQAAQGASNALGSMAGALGQDGGGGSLKGGSNASSVSTTRSVAQTPYEKPDSGTINLKSNVAGIGGQTDLDWLRQQMQIHQ